MCTRISGIVALALLLSVVQSSPSVIKSSASAPSQLPILSVNATSPLAAISPVLYGLFYEEITNAGQGSLLANLIQTANFEYVDWFPWTPLPATLPPQLNVVLSLNHDQPLNEAQMQSLAVRTQNDDTSAHTVGILNPGYWQGINCIDETAFNVSFFVYSADVTDIDVSITAADDSTVIYGTTHVTGISGRWMRVETVITLTQTTDPAASFTVTWRSPPSTQSAVYFDVFNVRSSKLWRGLPFIRPYVADKVAALNPAFVRFPGGCFVEGDYLGARFDWTKALGRQEDRKGHWSLWGYYSEDELGIYEYLSWIEQMRDPYNRTTRAIWTFNNGMSHHDQIPIPNLHQWIQDALDGIEFALGDVTTPFGRLRAEMGHPAPFNNLFAVSIGNEGCFDANYDTHYYAFYQVLIKRYPDLILIANCPQAPSVTQVYDYHTYQGYDDFINQRNLFDTTDPKLGQIFASEYAVDQSYHPGNVREAVVEAVWMNMLERNSPKVWGAAYGVSIANTRFDPPAGYSPRLVLHNGHQVIGTTAFYTQQLYSQSFIGCSYGTVVNLPYNWDDTATQVSVAIIKCLLDTTTPFVSTLTLSEPLSSMVSLYSYALKIVSWNNASVSFAVDLQGLMAAPMSALLKTMTSADIDNDRNNYMRPNHVTPVTTQVKFDSPKFNVTVARWSINILRIFTSESKDTLPLTLAV